MVPPRPAILAFAGHAIGLPFLRAVNPAEADAFRARVVQDFNGVAVEDGDDEGGGRSQQRRSYWWGKVGSPRTA